MFHIVLYQPEIPPNTGNLIRLAANTGCRLHLVEPLGFSLEEKALRRAGLDYRDLAHVTVHADWAAVRHALPDARFFAYSTRGERRYDQVEHCAGDALVFGPETRGLGSLLAGFAPQARVYLPMMPGNRSLNLSNAVSVVVYAAWQQQAFAGVPPRGSLPDAP
jgi:tRNA (cytidine/uridine-2'-O-)-methyltransferase